MGVAAQTASAGVNVGIAVLAPAIRDEFGLTLAQTGIVLAAVNGGITAGLIPWGLLADRLGERVTLGAGLAGAAVALVGATAADAFPLLVVALVATGLCTASVIPSSGRALMYWFGPEHRGLAVGIRQSGAPLGGLAAALVLPPIVSAGGLDAALVSLAIPCAVSAAVGFVYLAVGGDEIEEHEHVRPFRDARIWRVSWSGFLLFTTQAATVGFVVLFLHEERGLSAAAAAAVLGLIQVGGALLRIGWGRRSDLRRRRIEPIRALAVATAAALFVVALTTHAPLALTIAALVVAGSVSMSPTGLLFAATAEFAGRRRSGAALGLQQTVLGLAATGSPVLFAAVVTWSSWSLAYAGAALFPLAAYAVLHGPIRDL